MKETTTSPEVVDERRLRALQIAEECIALLKSRFGARRVILFGSLAGQGAWHSRSDIDLAVEGLDPEDFFKAYGACCDLVPRDLELDIDLVPLENAYPEMRARILGEVEMPDDPIQAMKALVEDELIALARVEQEMEETLAECARPPTRLELRAVATLLHEFYNGTERILERIVVGLGEDLPRGAYWHADLLDQVATAQESSRPAVISGPLRAWLEDYRRFRHFFRHAYNYTLEWNRLRWKAENMSHTLEMLRQQLQAFFDSLAKDETLSGPS